MEDEAKRGWTIQHDGGEPLPASIAELVERWLAVTDRWRSNRGLVIAAEELTLLAPATSRGFSRLPPIEGQAIITAVK